MRLQLPPKRGTTLQFSVHVHCGQTAGWMNSPLGTEVDLGTGHIVLDGVPCCPQKEHSSPPLFGPYLLWPRSPISATAELLLHSSRQRVPTLLPPFAFQNCPIVWGRSGNPVLWAHPSPQQSKRHLNRFSRFCRAHDRDKQTDRQTDHDTPSVTIGRIYVRSTAMRPNNTNVN